MSPSVRETYIREALEHLNRGEFELALARCHDDVEMKRVDGILEGGEVRGKEAVRAFLTPDVFASQVFNPREVFEGDDVVVVHALVRNRGAGSGIEIETSTWLVYFFDGELVHRIEAWRERGDAARAAGIEL